MNSGKETTSGGAGNGAEPDDMVAKLMNLAGPRADIPSDIELRVHDRVRGEWRNAFARYRLVRWVVPAALAASVVIAVGLALRPADPTQLRVGTVARAVGSASVAGRSISVGDVLATGDVVETGPGSGLSVALADGVSLRIGAGSSVRLDRADSLFLIDGRLYADSGNPVYRRGGITIITPRGSVTDVGTQFSVVNANDGLSVAVREGRVDFRNDRTSYSTVAGERLIVQVDGDIRREDVAAWDPAWEWAEALAPAFDAEQKSVHDFLGWASRETGRQLVFSNDDVRMEAMRAELYGPVSSFTPSEAIEAVLSTTRFTYELDERSIVISKAISK